MKEGFCTIEEILQEVADESKEGFSYREVKDIWEHQKKFIKQQMDKEDVYAINLPFVGTLSLNVKQFKREIRKRPREVYRNFIEKVKKLMAHEHFTEYANAHKKVTGVNKLARYIIRHYHTEVDVPRRLIPHKQCWGIIEKYSNGVYEKRDEILTNRKIREDVLD